MKVAIVGAGVAGLAAAQRILKLSQDARPPGEIELTVFEASPRIGGIIETVREDGFIVELGPDSFTTLKPAGLALCNELGLANNLISTNKQHRRAFIARKNLLNPLPEGFVLIAPTRFDTFFKSNIMSRSGKLRMAIEQFILPAKALADESVASFVNRRFGPEAVACIAQPMVGGIYTADISRLSLRATMPQYLEYEEKFGSVAAGLRRAKTSEQVTGARYSAFVSPDSGMQLLVETLTSFIGAQRIRLSTAVTRIRPASPAGWHLSLANGACERFDSVILAVPTAAASRLLADVDQALSHSLSKIKYASSVVACLLFPRDKIGHALDGFGFVVPAREKKLILAASFASVKFALRCPEDKVMIRVFMGGVLQPTAWQLSDEDLLARAVCDLGIYLDLKGPPDRHWIKRWPDSMPQYDVGHLDLVREIENGLARHVGLFYAGAGLRGVGIPDCIASGDQAARLSLALGQVT